MLILVLVVSPLSLLKNPMILIAGASMLLVFGLPYLMENSAYILLPFSTTHANMYFSVDPEMRAEFEEQQKKPLLTSNPAANSLQNFDAAAWLAGSNSKKTESAPTPAKRGEKPEGGITR